MDQENKNHIQQLEEEIRKLKNEKRQFLEKERILDTLINNVPGVVYRCANDQDWTMEYISSFSEELTGYPAKDFIHNTKRAYADIIVEEHASFVWEEIQKAIDIGTKYKLEYKITHKDGTEKWVFEQGVGVYNEQNELQALEGIIIDINERKIAEKSLQDSEARFKSILTSMDDLLFTFDKQKHFTYCHYPSIERLLLPPEEFIGKHHKDVMPPFISELFDKAFDKIILGESGIFEYEIEVNGELNWYSVNLSPIIIDNEFSGAVAVVRNISHDKRSQLAIQEGQIKYKSLFDQANDAIYLVDIEKRKLLDVNKRAEEMSEYSREELLQMDIMDLHPKEEHSKMSGDYSLKKYNGILHGFKGVHHKTKSGKLIPIEVNASVFELGEKQYNLSIIRDISERVESEKSLKELSTRLELAVISADIGIWDWDVPSASLLWDERMYQLYDIDKNQCGDILQTWKSMIHPDDYERVFQNMKSAFERGESTNDIFRVVMPDKSVKTIKMHAVIVRENGVAIRLVGVNFDITTEKQHEMQIQVLNEQLEERVQQRTAELEQANKDLEAFAYSVSHDLRSPLRHIEGFTKIIHGGFENLDDDQQRYFDKVFESTDKMQQLIHDLLTFSRLGRKELKMVKVDLNYLLKEILLEIEQETKERKIEWSLVELPFVSGDPSLLKIVFVNLLSNAVKFTSTRDVALIQMDYKIVGDNQIRISIMDNGVGFDMQFVDKLFGVFQRLHTEDQFSGTGIGLANVKRIIDKHHGIISAEAIVDQGATFHVTLNTI